MRPSAGGIRPERYGQKERRLMSVIQERPAPGCRGGASRGSSGGLGERSDAREHGAQRPGSQDPPGLGRDRRSPRVPLDPEGLGAHPAGLHLEVAVSAVTECVGGAVREEMLPQRYTTLCDPRLNSEQASELLQAGADRAAVSPGGALGRAPGRRSRSRSRSRRAVGRRRTSAARSERDQVRLM